MQVPRTRAWQGRSLEGFSPHRDRVDAELVIRGGNVATLRGDDGPRAAEAAADVGLEAGWTVAVHDGRIAWLGPDDAWQGHAGRTIDARGHLVTPGYVDCHNHLVYAGDRAFEMSLKASGKPYLDILAAGGGIMHTVRATRRAGIAGLMAEVRPRMQRMVRQGTTCFEAKSGYGLQEKAELDMLEAAVRLGQDLNVPVVPTFLGAHAVPAGMTADAYMEAVIAMLPAVAAQGRAKYCDAFVEKDVFTVEQAEVLFAAAKRHGLGVRLHADEIVHTGGAELAAKAGCVSADHLLRVSPAGIQAMAEAGTVATLMPTVPITMMKPEWPSGRAMLEAGIPIALATDHNPNNPVTSMSFVAQLGGYLLGLSPEQALTAVTHNAAATLGLPEVGRIDVGMRADLLVHDVPDLEHWVYEPGRDTVTTVVSGGTVVREPPT